MFNSLIALCVLSASLLAFAAYGVRIRSGWTLALALTLLVIALLGIASIVLALRMPPEIIPV